MRGPGAMITLAMAMCLLIGAVSVSAAGDGSSRGLLSSKNDSSHKNMTAGPWREVGNIWLRNITYMNETGESVKTDDGNASLSVNFFKERGAGLNLMNSTIFVPSNMALSKLAKFLNVTNVTDIFSPPLLNTSLSILSLHVVPGALNASSIPSGTTSLPTATPGVSLNVTKPAMGAEPPSPIEVSGPNNPKPAHVIVEDIPFETNIVHVIDRVLY